jgi:hypothetical protein
LLLSTNNNKVNSNNTPAAVDACRLLCSFTSTNNINNNRGGHLVLSLSTKIMAAASLPVDKEVINVDDDDNDDEWQSLFHVSKEAVEGVISSRKNEGGKKKENLALLEFIATKGKESFTEGYPLGQEDTVFFAQLASTAQLKQRKRNEAWTSSVLAGHVCRFYMLLKKHDLLYGIDRIVNYETAIAVDETTPDALGDAPHSTTTAPDAAASTAAAAAADLSKTTTTASTANLSSTTTTSPVDLEVMAKLASLEMLMRNSIARATGDKEGEEGRTRASMSKQSDFMKKNQKKPMQQNMKFDPNLESKFPCIYCGHHTVMSTLQSESNERNKQKTAQYNKDLAKWNRLAPSQKKKTEKPKPPKDTVQQLEVCMCSMLNCRGRVDGNGCSFCVAMSMATGQEPPKDESNRCMCEVCQCICTAAYPLSARFDIANRLADETEAGTTAADAPTAGKFIISMSSLILDQCRFSLSQIHVVALHRSMFLLVLDPCRRSSDLNIFLCSFSLKAGLIGDFLYQLGDVQMNNMMLQQTTNDNPLATSEDMYRNACGMTATQLMQSRAIQNNVELRSAIQTLLIPRAHQPIISGRNDPMTLAEHRQQKKKNLATQKQQKAAAREQQQQQHHRQQQSGIGTGPKKAPPPASAGATTSTTTTPAVNVTTTPATAATTTSCTSTLVSGRWSTGSNLSAAVANNFVGAGSNNSRAPRNRLSTTTNTPDPFSVTASLFPPHDHGVVGGCDGRAPPSHEPPPPCGGRGAVDAAIADVASTPRRGRAKRVRISIMKELKKNPGAGPAYRAVVQNSPTALQMLEDSIGVMCTQDAAETLMEMYNEAGAK